MTTADPSLPPTCRAIWCESPSHPVEIRTIPTPQPEVGSVVVKVIASQITNAVKAIIEGRNPGFNPPFPFVPGARAVGRVAAIGPDTTSLEVGQLVLFEPFVVGRDDPSARILMGATHMGGASEKLIKYWRHGTYAEYVRTPLENTWAMNEKLLCSPKPEGGFGYTPTELVALCRHMVAYGGWKAINLQAGETVVVAPSTGGYSGAAVEVASAMGARVIAASRNLSILQKMKATIPRIEIVQLTGDVTADSKAMQQFGPVDAFMDYCPSSVKEAPSHIASGMMSLRPYGRASFMGFIQGSVALPYALIVARSITIQGTMMYTPQNVRDLIKLVETGLLRLGSDANHVVKAEFRMEEFAQALEMKESWGENVVLTP